METQETVSAWALETFGPRDLKYRARMVLEEAVELAMASGCGFEDVIRTVHGTMMKSEPTTDNVSEAADVYSCLLAYAEQGGFSAQEALNTKMAYNRTRSKEYYEGKQKYKQELRIIDETLAT